MHTQTSKHTQRERERERERGRERERVRERERDGHVFVWWYSQGGGRGGEVTTRQHLLYTEKATADYDKWYGAFHCAAHGNNRWFWRFQLILFSGKQSVQNYEIIRCHRVLLKGMFHVILWINSLTDLVAKWSWDGSTWIAVANWRNTNRKWAKKRSWKERF